MTYEPYGAMKRDSERRAEEWRTRLEPLHRELWALRVACLNHPDDCRCVAVFKRRHGL